MGLLSNSNAIESGGYSIDRSLRFRSSASAYLNRTPASAGNRTTWTWSAWVKRGSIGTGIQELFTIYFDTSLAIGGEIRFDTGDTITLNFQNNAGALNSTITTSQVFRDASAWYHIVVTYDTTQATASNRVRLYVNGIQVTAFSSATYPSLNNATCEFNYTKAHYIGMLNYGGSLQRYFDGYLAEVNFIDGQALTPSSFGQTDPVTGVWTPKKYTGTYGTNGFYLDFKNNTSATTLAYDKSGNGNNWTANNISTTAGATYDSMTDVPTLTSATAANFATLNPLTVYGNSNVSVFNANLNISLGTTAQWRSYSGGTIPMDVNGKWYLEVTPLSGSAADITIGVATSTLTMPSGDYYPNKNANCWTYFAQTGAKSNNNTDSAYGSSYAANDVVGISLDMTNGQLTFYKNGVSQGVAYTLSTSNSYVVAIGGASSVPNYSVNFGQRPFSYTPPTGFKALNTFNLPDPVIKKPNQYMDATTYTGTGANQSIVNAGSFQPDFVWMKARSINYDNTLQDSTRGTSAYLFSNTTAAEGTTSNLIQSFNANGFTAGSSGNINQSGQTYVAWQWKKGATAGFDIVTYTGNAVQGRQVSHSLGVAPKFIITKSRSAGGYDWNCWFTGFSDNQYIALNSTAAKGTDANTFPSAAGMTATYFTIGSGAWINGNGTTYVAYLFAEIPGFSKFGSYTGNGSADGPFVYCGFRPRWVMVKSTGASNWFVWDTERNRFNATTTPLFPNGSSAEEATLYPIDVLSNGFKLRGAAGLGINESATYIFAAFAETPFKTALAR